MNIIVDFIGNVNAATNETQYIKIDLYKYKPSADSIADTESAATIESFGLPSSVTGLYNA
jgi:hypothetical protein